MNPLLTCADCNEFFRESDCGERVHLVRSEAWGATAATRAFSKCCPNCTSEEICDAEVEDVYAELQSVTATLRDAERKLALSQMEAGAFQTEAQLLRSELAAIRRVA